MVGETHVYVCLGLGGLEMFARVASGKGTCGQVECLCVVHASLSDALTRRRLNWCLSNMAASYFEHHIKMQPRWQQVLQRRYTTRGICHPTASSQATLSHQSPTPLKLSQPDPCHPMLPCYHRTARGRTTARCGALTCCHCPPRASRPCCTRACCRCTACWRTARRPMAWVGAARLLRALCTMVHAAPCVCILMALFSV